MRIEVSEAALVDELAQSLRRCEYCVVRTGRHELEAWREPAEAGVAEIECAAELELDLYLKVWEAKHHGLRASRPRGAQTRA